MPTVEYQCATQSADGVNGKQRDVYNICLRNSRDFFTRSRLQSSKLPFPFLVSSLVRRNHGKRCGCSLWVFPQSLDVGGVSVLRGIMVRGGVRCF